MTKKACDMCGAIIDEGPLPILIDTSDWVWDLDLDEILADFEFRNKDNRILLPPDLCRDCTVKFLKECVTKMTQKHI